jgi:formylglycine-generating enzyme required for sulfatase activity
MAEPFSFLTFANLERLVQKLASIRGARREELARIGDVFGDPHELARYYVEPKCQHHNPADRHEDREPVSQVRAPAFDVINEFLRGDFTPLGDGRTQMFILSDAGMGKTSLLTMIRLMHLMAFWPRGYDCLLLKLGEDTLERIAKHSDKAHTVLLLDALDEDPLAWGVIESRLVALLDASAKFRRVILSCRTQFFPETGADAFGRPGRVEVGGYTCPMFFLSPFDETQVDAYLRKRFPDRWHERLLGQDNPLRLRAEKLVGSMQSLRFRPLLLAHIRDILDAGERDWNAYSLYQALVDRWLDREERKLRKQLPHPPSKETLWRVCTAVALHMQSRGERLLERPDLDVLTAGFPELASLEHFDVGGRSLLNRTAANAFRFSHYSIQEFLVVHALSADVVDLPSEPLRVTAQMLAFLALEPRMPSIEHLDLSGLQPGNLADFSFQDRLADGSLGPAMQLILPGTFLMGATEQDPDAQDSEAPQHRVRIPQVLALGRFPVTFEEYGRFAVATGRKKPSDEGWGRGRRPVIHVSWKDAAAYCEWLSEQTGRRYRLPTEAEWEYATRAGTESRWSFGDEEAGLAAHAWYQANSGGRTHPVGEKRPNPWGLYDLHGNVWEWIQDAWHSSYERAPADGSSWDSADSGAYRVIRGGSWIDDARSCRCACRSRYEPELRDYFLGSLGFRCARAQV